MSIVVENISKFYAEQKAVDNISFSIKKGEIVGFIGPNGAGKSTTMKIITTYLMQSSGKVFVKGIDTQKSPLEVRKIIGYLPENNPLYHEMYIKEYLEYTAKIYGIKNPHKKISDVIEMTGLTREEHKKIGQLSKGYKQRVGLAAAIIHDPEILILDEPTSGLDPNQIVEIRNLIQQLGTEKTVMLSTHIMQEVEAICDRIIIIDKGKIVADDKLDKIQYKAKEQTLSFVVEFDKQIEKQMLLSIEKAEEIHHIKNNLWLITSSTDIRKAIFDFAVENHLAVLALQQKSKTLEEIFRELTDK